MGVREGTATRERLILLAQRGAEEWKPDDLAASPEAITSFVTQLSTATPEMHECLRDALPHILAFFQEDAQYPRAAFSAIYEMLRFQLALCWSLGTTSDLVLYHDLLEMALVLGVSESQYGQLLDEVQELWQNAAASSTLDAMLDILNSLIIHRCPASYQVQRHDIAVMVFSAALPWIQFESIGMETCWVLRRLASVYGVADIFTKISWPWDSAEALDAGTGTPLSSFHGMIAIYTLTESAALRAKEILQEQAVNCRIELSTDKVGGPRLRDLARNADIFVMVTASAKHAATQFIETHRGNKLLLRPNGKGTSSILREIVLHVNK